MPVGSANGMKLSIISINFKNPQLTLESMETLYGSYKKEFDDNIYEYIVVDNHSEDDSLKLLSQAAKHYHGFHCIENGQNNGFGAGNNFGVTHAKGDYLLFLNNDTQVKGKGISEMVAFLDGHPEAGIVGGELQNFDGTAQASTGKFFSLFPTILFLMGMQRFGVTDRNPKNAAQVDWVKGACLMIRKGLFEKLHGFDENIFMYTEDMELCYRAHKAGARIYFYPTKGILHKDQGSTNRTFAILHIYKNIPYFYTKHMPLWQLLSIRVVLISKATILVILGKITHNQYLSSTYAQALNVLR